MAFESLSDFFLMGKHGAYVWGAYGLTFAALLLQDVLSHRQQRSLRQQLHLLEEEKDER